MKLKEKLNVVAGTIPYCREGEKWWVHFGENIGIEMNGKGPAFARPVIIFKKLNSQTLFVIPLTTKQKKERGSFLLYLRAKESLRYFPRSESSHIKGWIRKSAK